MAKGSQFERDIARKISLWLTNNKRDDCVWRTSQSGGRATQRAKKNLRTAGAYGDLCSTHESTKLFFDNVVVELKKGYSSTNALDLLDSKQKEPLLIKFWNQCEKSRIDGNKKYGIVIIERDRKKQLIMAKNEFLYEMELFFGSAQHDWININICDLSLAIIRFNDFLKWIPEWNNDFFEKD